MHQTIVRVEPFKEPKLYNFGYRVPEMQAARDFYANKLGFIARSEKYLPLDLPLGHVDMNYGKPGERPRTDENIARVALPAFDPIFGKSGPLIDHWTS